MTDGAMGEVPLWYRVVKAAVYLGVPPWEMEVRPYRYLRMAEVAQAAEAASQSQRKPNPE